MKFAMCLALLVSLVGCERRPGRMKRIRPIIAVPIIRHIIHRETPPEAASEKPPVSEPEPVEETPAEPEPEQKRIPPQDFGDPIPQRSEPVQPDCQPAPKEVLPALQISLQALQENMPARGWKMPPPAPLRRVQLVFLSTEGCVKCYAPMKEFVDVLVPKGWTFSEDHAAHIRLVDVPEDSPLEQEWGVDKFPAFVLMVDGQETIRHKSYPGWKKLVEEFEAAVKTLGPLPMRAEPPAFAAGSYTTPAEKIDLLLAYLGNDPASMRLGNAKREEEFQHGVKLSVPAHVGFDCTTTAGVKRIVFTEPKPKVSWGWITSDVDAVTTDGKKANIELPGLPDPVIDLIKEYPQSQPFAAVALAF